MGSCESSSSDKRSGYIQLESKINAAKLEVAELRLEVMQKDVAMKPMTKDIVESEKQVECWGSKKELLLQTNEKVLQCLRLTRMLVSKAKKSLVDSVPHEVIGIAVKVEDAFHKWCETELFELTHQGKQTVRDWTNRGETGVEGDLERQNGSKILPYSPLKLSGYVTFCILSKTEAEQILIELIANDLKGEPWLRICSNKERLVMLWKLFHVVHY